MLLYKRLSIKACPQVMLTMLHMREIEAVAPTPTSFFARSKAKEESQADDARRQTGLGVPLWREALLPILSVGLECNPLHGN